ncbi:MAG: hypothetical protein JWR10_1490 [Rubritepida sp.]|nr:hypothetical protein [Rubritepida sp.]
MSINMMSRLASETLVLRTRLETLTRQSADGLRSDKLGDLGPDVSRLVSLRGEIGRREVYGKSMDQALGRTGIVQQSLSRMTEIAREFRTTVVQRISSDDPNSLTTVAAQARSALSELANLLNTQNAGEFLFGGADLANPPIPNPDALATGQMAQDVAAQVGGLGTIDAATISAATLGIAKSTAAGVSPFSDFLNAEEALAPADRAARRGVPSQDGEIIGYGVMANRNAEAVSSGDTTGGWARDLMRGLMTLAALTPAQMATDPVQFDKLISNVREGLLASENALGEEAGALGHVEARMATVQTRHGSISTVLEGQVSDIQYVDMAETLSQLEATRTTLDASYRAIGSISGLTLANFLR